jgi:drug/metabolite transporter (DMT)-like permease
VTTGAALGLTAALVAALLFGIGAVVQAHAVRRMEAPAVDLAGFVVSSVRDPWTMGVVAAYLVGFALHAVAIWLLPLYLAQAAVAMSLPVTAVASTVLHERLTPVHWWAVGAVTVGLVLLSAGSGRPGTLVAHWSFALLLWLGAAVVGLAGWRGVGLGGGALGTLSGLAYAGSAIAVRGVGTPVDPAIVVSAAAVGVYGLLGFWLYSVGLERAPVSSTTAPLIVSETFVPALVGVLLLGDGVRTGWWPAVVAGLLLSTAGAIWLSRDEGVRSPGGPATGSSPGAARRPGPRSRRSS